MNASLSLYEMQLVTDPQILLAKNRIINTVYQLFGELATEYKREMDNNRLQLEGFSNAKISRGENYKGLAYVIMDYPRLFSKIDVFAIRSFFWWGNFFSITIHLAGGYKKKYAASIENAIHQGLFNGWFIGTSKDQWEHHFESDNYTPVDNDTVCNIHELPFLKLAKKIPLKEWDKMNWFFTQNFQLIIKALVN